MHDRRQAIPEAALASLVRPLDSGELVPDRAITQDGWMPIAAEEIEELARLAAGGDDQALDTLLTEIRPQVLGHCRRLFPFAEDAEDACQDVMLRVAQHITSFAGRARFSTWLYHVTTNSSRNTYRRLRSVAENSTDTPPERPDPRTTSVIAGSRLDLLDALDRLESAHPALIEPFVLRDLYDLPYADIAEHLNLRLGTVKRRIHDARDWMRGALDSR
ncbi:MAG: RNA polymerase sigma factor [Nocardioides sp.]